MNLANREPMGLKRPKQKDPKHLARVGQLPCVICAQHGFHQVSRTEVHHCKSGRFSQQKACDYETLPLCHGHHHKLIGIPGEEDFVGFHNAQETWERLYGPDTSYLPVVADMLANEWNPV